MAETEVEVVDGVVVDEHLNLRRLPPVDPVEPPSRWSQTILRHGNTCQRAAYLYQRHHGGLPGHQLDRGTAFHLAWAKTTNLILERYAIDAGEDGDVDYSVDEHTAKLMLEEVFDEHPELTVPLHERDELRVMMSHMANGFSVNPAQVVAVERKFVLTLGEYKVSAILDLALISGTAAIIRDAKTQWDAPSQAEYAASFQGRLYAVVLVYGQPVTEIPCEAGCGTRCPLISDCEICEGRGYTERLEAPLGEHLQAIDVGEIFPRYMSCGSCGAKAHTGGRCDECGGTMEVAVRNMPLARIEIDALRRDIEDQCAQLAKAFETNQFPAVTGSHCARCPCEPECPLPRNLRNYAGAIQTEAEAAEAMEWYQRNNGRIKATKAEVKNFCKIHGPLRFGVDLIAEFAEVKRWETNWTAIEQGAARAAQYGEPFDMGEHRRQKAGTDFVVRKLTEIELAAERDAKQQQDEEAA
jgi:hypothetical protein